MRFTSDSTCKLLFLPIKKLNMKKLIIMLISVISMYSASAQKYTDQYIKDASIVAESWLSDINDKQYESAYRLLTSETKANYIREEWIFFLRELMLEFGKFQERKITSSIFQGSIEGLEDGFYVIIEYNSNYKNTINHEEYLLVKQNDKLKWEIESFNYKFVKLDGSK